MTCPKLILHTSSDNHAEPQLCNNPSFLEEVVTSNKLCAVTKGPEMTADIQPQDHHHNMTDNSNTGMQ